MTPGHDTRPRHQEQLMESHTHSDPQRAAPTSLQRHIGLLLFDGVEELDAVGPWEVLAYWTLHHPEDGWSISCLSAGGADVIGAKNLVLGAHHSLDDAPALEVLIHPGGHGTRRLLRDAEHLDWIRAQRAVVPVMASVCTGSLVYAAAGLLTGRPATTHWASLNLLSELDPTVETDVQARFVDDGDLITSAGVSAGIDMALHLVARLAGTERAREVRRGIQYDPHPPV
jgi:transcriptional regulator GlxA family with amidase domain